MVRMTQSGCPLVAGGAVPRVVGGSGWWEDASCEVRCEAAAWVTERLGAMTPLGLGAVGAHNELWQEQLVR